MRCIPKHSLHPADRPFPDASEWTVFPGQHLVKGMEKFEISLGVANITLSNMNGSNIALLHLVDPDNYRKYIQPVCVDINNERSLPVGSQCWVASWENESNGTGKALSRLCVLW